MKARFFRALSLALLLLASPAAATQSTIVTPTTGPLTMAGYAAVLNAALVAIQGCNYGSSAPANGPSAAPVTYQCWADNTTNPVVFKVYDGASWVVFGKLNTSTHVWTPVFQGTDLSTAATATTGTSGHTVGFLDGANTWSGVQTFSTPIAVASGGSGRATLTNHGVLLGQGTTGFVTAAAMTDGQLLIGQSSADPAPTSVTGDVTIDRFGVTAIGTAKVSSAMLRNSGALSVVGRSANSSGVPGDISCTAGSDAVLRESGSVLGCGTIATAGLANNAVTDAKIRQGVARSVVGVTGNATANVADIQGTTDQVLRVNGAGTVLGFGAIDVSKAAAATGILQAALMPALSGDISNSAGSLVTAIGANKVTDSMLRQGGALTLVGRSANSTGNVADIAAVAGSSCVFRESANSLVCSTIATASIAANAVTNAKLAQMATATFKCRTTAGTGDPEDCTAAQSTALLNAVVGDSGAGGTKGLAPAPASGDGAARKVLEADGTYHAPSGTGGVVGTGRSVATGCGLAGGGDLSADRTIRVSLAVNSQTGTSYPVVDGDCGKLVRLNNASSVAVSMPQASTLTSSSGWFVDFQNVGAGPVTVTPTTSTINGAANQVLLQNQGMHCDSDGTNYTCVLGVGSGGGSGVTSIVGGGVTIVSSGTLPPTIGLINHSIAVSASGSALTIALKDSAGNDPSSSSPVTGNFRSATSTSGGWIQRSVTAANSLVISSGSTMGVVSSTAFRIWVVLFDDASTMRLGAINCSDATRIYPLNEAVPASSTAEGGAGAADSAGVFYTGAAVSSKSFLIVGYVDWTPTGVTAGTWTTTNVNSVQSFGPGIRKPGEPVGNSSIGQSGAVATGVTTIPIDNTIPQITEGTEFYTAAIIPTSAANRLRIQAELQMANSAANLWLIAAIFQDATANALAVATQFESTAGASFRVPITYEMVAGTTSSTTLRLRAGSDGAGTLTINGTSGARLFGGAYLSFIRIDEIMG